MPQPKKHHYIPSFYLKRWAGLDDRLCQYSRPNGRVVCNRKHPNATGYMDRLYELRSFPPELAQQVEQNFFKTVDSLAADALSALENGRALTSRERSAWSRFILSLLLRGPDDIADLRSMWSKEFRTSSPEAEEFYSRVKNDDWEHDTFADYLASLPQHAEEKHFFEVFFSLVDNKRLGEYINNVTWELLDTRNSRFRLLTSDQPVVRSNGLRNKDGHIALAIGPNTLFIASHEKGFVRTLGNDVTSIVRAYNVRVVESAIRYVWGLDDTNLRFIQNRMSTNNKQRFVTQFLKRRPYSSTSDSLMNPISQKADNPKSSGQSRR